MKILIEKINPDAKIPERATNGSAGYDLSSVEECTIKLGERILLKTGLKFQIPSGYEGQIRPRSGLALKYGLTVLNTPGTLDSDYRGELSILLINLGDEEYKIQKGERIAQLVISKFEEADFQVTSKLEETSRSESGFGSSGK